MPGEPEPGPGIDLRRLPWPAVWARPSRAPVLALVVLLGLVLAITPFVALTELREPGLDPRAGMLLGIALVVAGSLPLRAGARGRGGTTGLLFTPAGLVHRTAGIERVVRWSEVLGVTATAADAPAALVGVSRVAAPNGQAGALDRRVAPDLIIRLGDLAVDPVLGLEILRFYASHPRPRAELGTGADVRRVRRLDLPTN